jgi:hypothetical protein
MRISLRAVIIYTLFFILGAIILGMYSCSSAKDKSDELVFPDSTDSFRKAHASWLDEGRGPLASVHVRIPAEGGAPVILDDRSGDFHADVTAYLNPPNCTQCLVIGDFNPIEGGLFGLVTIRNMFDAYITSSAFDIRLVVESAGDIHFLSGTASDILMEPDGFTGLYKSEKYMTNISPYLNFGAFEAGYSIPTGDEYTREVKLRTSKTAADVDFIVDVSWRPPSLFELGVPTAEFHCAEAYRIDATLTGSLIPGDYGVNIAVDVYDWQNDEYDATVLLEAPSLFHGTQQLELTDKNADCATFSGFILSSSQILYAEKPILIKVIDTAEKKNGSHATAYQLASFNIE